MCRTGINLIDKYTTYFFKILRLDGFGVTMDEVASELSLAYAKTLDRMNNGQVKFKGSDNENAPAKFETYVIRAFRNQICDFRKGLIEDSNEQKMRVDIDVDLLVDADGCFNNAECLMVADEFKTALLDALDGLSKTIAKEMFEPSEAIMALMAANNEALCNAVPENLLKGKSTGSLAKAVAEVYELTERQVRYQMKKIKLMAKKVLTNYPIKIS